MTMIGNHSNDRFDEMYSTMIAGSVPSHSGDTEQSVLFLAKDILNVSSLHTIVKESKEHRRVFYFAVPSASLHSTIEPRTALVAAIPGHKDHRGDGIYSLPMGLMTAAAIFKEGDLLHKEFFIGLGLIVLAVLLQMYLMWKKAKLGNDS